MEERQSVLLDVMNTSTHTVSGGTLGSDPEGPLGPSGRSRFHPGFLKTTKSDEPRMKSNTITKDKKAARYSNPNLLFRHLLLYLQRNS